MTLTPIDEPEVATDAPKAPKGGFRLIPLDDAPPAFKLTPLDEPPASRGTQMQEMKGDLPPPVIPEKYSPLLAAGGRQVGSYKLGQAQNGLADVHVNINHPTTNETQTDTLQVPLVTDDMVAAERQKAQDALTTAQKRAERLTSGPSPTDFPELGSMAGQAQEAVARNLAVRAQQLASPDAKSFLQNEQIQNAFQGSAAGKKFNEWHPGEDIARGFAGLETGLNYAYQSTLGTPEAEKQAREAVSSVPEAFPGTSTNNPVMSTIKGGTEMLGQIPLIANPVGAATLGVSTYGQTVANTMNGADAADEQAKAFDQSNPEMAAQFRELATSMRSDAKLHGALSGATMALAGKVLPQAKTFLGATGRSAAEFAGINTVEDVLNQQLSGTAPNPQSTVEGALAGGIMGAAHGVMPHKAEALENLAKVEKTDQEFDNKIKVSQEIINEGAKNPDTSQAAIAAAEKLTTKIPKEHEAQKEEITEALKPLTETPTEEKPDNATPEVSQQESLPVQPESGTASGEEAQTSPSDSVQREAPSEKIVSATFTDENGVAKTSVLPIIIGNTGIVGAGVNSIVDCSAIDFIIRAQASSTITILTSITGVGVQNYDIGVTLEQLR